MHTVTLFSLLVTIGIPSHITMTSHQVMTSYGHLLCMRRCEETGHCRCVEFSETNLICALVLRPWRCESFRHRVYKVETDACGRELCLEGETCLQTRTSKRVCVSFGPKPATFSTFQDLTIIHACGAHAIRYIRMEFDRSSHKYNFLRKNGRIRFTRNRGIKMEGERIIEALPTDPIIPMSKMSSLIVAVVFPKMVSYNDHMELQLGLCVATAIARPILSSSECLSVQLNKPGGRPLSDGCDQTARRFGQKITNNTTKGAFDIYRTHRGDLVSLHITFLFDTHGKHIHVYSVSDTHAVLLASFSGVVIRKFWFFLEIDSSLDSLVNTNPHHKSYLDLALSKLMCG